MRQRRTHASCPQGVFQDADGAVWIVCCVHTVAGSQHDDNEDHRMPNRADAALRFKKDAVLGVVESAVALAASQGGGEGAIVVVGGDTNLNRHPLMEVFQDGPPCLRSLAVLLLGRDKDFIIAVHSNAGAAVTVKEVCLTPTIQAVYKNSVDLKKKSLSLKI